MKKPIHHKINAHHRGGFGPDAKTRGHARVLYSFRLLHYKRLLATAYLLIFAARLAELFTTSIESPVFWWADTVLLAWLVIFLTFGTALGLGTVGFAKIGVASLSVYHVADLVLFIMPALQGHHTSLLHLLIKALFALLAVVPTALLLLCDLTRHAPLHTVIHWISTARIVLLIAEMLLLIFDELLVFHPMLFYVAILFTLTSHILFELALHDIAHHIHTVEDAAD